MTGGLWVGSPVSLNYHPIPKNICEDLPTLTSSTCPVSLPIIWFWKFMVVVILDGMRLTMLRLRGGLDVGPLGYFYRTNFSLGSRRWHPPGSVSVTWWEAPAQWPCSWTILSKCFDTFSIYTYNWCTCIRICVFFSKKKYRGIWCLLCLLKTCWSNLLRWSSCPSQARDRPGRHVSHHESWLQSAQSATPCTACTACTRCFLIQLFSRNMKTFRIIRLTRLLKTIQFVKIFRFVMALRMLVTSIMSTLKAMDSAWIQGPGHSVFLFGGDAFLFRFSCLAQALFWALVLLILVVYVFGVPGVRQRFVLHAACYLKSVTSRQRFGLGPFLSSPQVLFAQAVNDPDVNLPDALTLKVLFWFLSYKTNGFGFFGHISRWYTKSILSDTWHLYVSGEILSNFQGTRGSCSASLFRKFGR